MRRSREYNYYYDCNSAMFAIDADNECININHPGDCFVITFYELSEVGIDFSEENDYVLHIRCDSENYYFQFQNRTDANAVCIAILNRTLLLPERRGI